MTCTTNHEIKIIVDNYINQKICRFFGWVGLIAFIAIVLILMCNFYYTIGYLESSRRTIQIIMESGLK